MVHSIKIKFKWDVKEVAQVATTMSLNSKTVISFIQALETKEVKFQHKHQVRLSWEELVVLLATAIMQETISQINLIQIWLLEEWLESILWIIPFCSRN